MGLLGVDQSVYLLNNDNRMTSDRVSGLLKLLNGVIHGHKITVEAVSFMTYHRMIHY